MGSCGDAGILYWTNVSDVVDSVRSNGACEMLDADGVFENTSGGVRG